MEEAQDILEQWRSKWGEMVDTFLMLEESNPNLALLEQAYSREPPWVNADLLKMAESLEKQANETSDEDDFKRPRRLRLREAAIHLRQAFQLVSEISPSLEAK